MTARILSRNCRSWILPGGIIGGFRSVDPISGHVAMKMEIGAETLSITRLSKTQLRMVAPSKTPSLIPPRMQS